MEGIYDIYPRFLNPPHSISVQMELFAYVGGKVSPYNLLLAYSLGIFPWPENNHCMIWCSPCQRGVLFFDKLHVSKRLERIIRKKKIDVVFNKNFSTVVKYCASHPKRTQTWITPQLFECYCDLFKLKHAYSVEVYEDDQLTGGLFGICYGNYFSGESMFYHKSNASKIALISLVKHLNSQGIHWLDTQMISPVVASLGGMQIPRVRFLQMLCETDFTIPRERILENSYEI